MSESVQIVICPNCGREVAVIFKYEQFECPHCGQRWGGNK